jgi:hypothetical protein
MTSEIKKSCEPAKLLRSIDLPAFAPVAGTSLLWVRNADNDLFPKATGAFFYYLTPDFGNEFALPRSGFMQLRKNPDCGAFGRGAVVYGP